MNSETFVSSLTEKIQKETQEEVESLRDKIRRTVQEMAAKQEFVNMSQEEVNLIADFRVWKQTRPEAATGVFHWKVRK